MMDLSFLKKYFLSGLAGAIFLFMITGIAHAVMPLAHYAKLADQSNIKAIAGVKEIKIISKTKYHTQKQVIFKRVKGFGPNTPIQFSGKCYSVDQQDQKPLAGGTIYFYPIIGQKVLVTISDDSGQITSYTSLSKALERELWDNGLENIEYKMGKAVIQHDTGQWFQFYLKEKAIGYLMLKVNADAQAPGTAVLEQSLVISESKAKKMVFDIQTQFRQNMNFVLEWIVIKSPRVEEFGFRPSDRSVLKPGVLPKTWDTNVDIPVSNKTTTDFLLFKLIENLLFNNKTQLQIDVVETLELHYKKDILIKYNGRDASKKNLHRFDQTGPSHAIYWLDDHHRVVEVMWDSDKRFVKSSKAVVFKTFEPAQ